MEILNAELFQSGTWNGQPFTDDDLDDIVSSFQTLNLSGRIPLKIGHDGPDVRTDDTAPALGWVESVKRVGHKLLANITLTSERLANGIRSGAYKFVSVELLKNVQAGTRQLSWVLDAVALLGTTAPAVGTLKAISDSMGAFSSQRPALKFAERLSFSASGGSGPTVEQVRAEYEAKLMAARVDGEIEKAIATHQVLPTARDMFKRVFAGSNYTVENWQNFARTQPKPNFKPTRTVVGEYAIGEEDDSTEPAAKQLTRLCEAEVEKELVKFGRVVQIVDVAARVYKRHPELMRRFHEEQQ